MLFTCLAHLILLTVAAPPATEMPPIGPPPGIVEASPPVRERPGFTVTVGLGYGYGAFGIQLRYDRPLRPWLHLAPFLAAGPNFDFRSIAGAAGVSAGLGRRHRLAADFAIAPVIWEELILHDSKVDSRTIYGPNVGVGYEHASDYGRVQRVNIGYGWPMWSKGEGHFPSTITLNIGIGARAW